jgi:hypothetical protein
MEAISLIKAPEESARDFNARLRDASLERPVSDVQMALVHGQPMVTLCTGLDAADLEEPEDGEVDLCEIALGCGVCLLDATSSEACALSEDRIDKLLAKSRSPNDSDGDGNIVRTEVVTAEHYGFVKPPAELGTKDPIYLPIKVTYMLAVWELSEFDLKALRKNIGSEPPAETVPEPKPKSKSKPKAKGKLKAKAQEEPAPSASEDV